MKTVYVHLYSQSEPIKIEHVINTYTKDGLFCVLRNRTVISGRRAPQCTSFVNNDQYMLGEPFKYTGPERVDKFPVQHVFRIIEETP